MWKWIFFGLAGLWLTVILFALVLVAFTFRKRTEAEIAEEERKIIAELEREFRKR